MKTAIKKQILEMGYINGETLDHKAQSMLCNACAGDSPIKVERFHRLLREMTTGNHTLNGSPLTLKI